MLEIISSNNERNYIYIIWGGMQLDREKGLNCTYGVLPLVTCIDLDPHEWNLKGQN